MNIRIEKDFFFQSAVHFENKFYINSYEVSLSMLVETESMREQQVAMDRIAHFIEEVLQNSILVHNKDTASIKKYSKANIRVCELPEQPYDQIISMILLLKLNAIMEGRIKITDMIMGSAMSEGVKYNTVSEVAEGAFSGNTWWNKSCTCMKNHEETTSDDNIVQLFDDSKWADMDLSWKEKSKK
jgi:hypothetical protein